MQCHIFIVVLKMSMLSSVVFSVHRLCVMSVIIDCAAMMNIFVIYVVRLHIVIFTVEMFGVIMFSVVMLSAECLYADFRYADCCNFNIGCCYSESNYALCRVAECHYVVIILNVIMLNVIMLNVLEPQFQPCCQIKEINGKENKSLEKMKRKAVPYQNKNLFLRFKK